MVLGPAVRGELRNIMQFIVGKTNDTCIIRYRRGSDNLAADRLSRSAPGYDALINNEVEFFERHVYSVLEGNGAEANHSHERVLTERIVREQAQDPVIASAIKQINTTGSVKDGQLKKHAGLHLR